MSDGETLQSKEIELATLREHVARVEALHRRIISVSLHHDFGGLISCYEHLTFRLALIRRITGFPTNALADLENCRDNIGEILGELLRHDATWFDHLKPDEREDLLRVKDEGFETWAKRLAAEARARSDE